VRLSRYFVPVCTAQKGHKKDKNLSA
jgi:hypothetical protein